MAKAATALGVLGGSLSLFPPLFLSFFSSPLFSFPSFSLLPPSFLFSLYVSLTSGLSVYRSHLCLFFSLSLAVSHTEPGFIPITSAEGPGHLRKHLCSGPAQAHFVRVLLYTSSCIPSFNTCSQCHPCLSGPLTYFHPFLSANIQASSWCPIPSSWSRRRLTEVSAPWGLLGMGDR